MCSSDLPQPQRIRALHELLDESLDPTAMGLIRSDGSRTLSISELGAATAELAQANTETAPDDEIVRSSSKRRWIFSTVPGKPCSAG